MPLWFRVLTVTTVAPAPLIDIFKTDSSTNIVPEQIPETVDALYERALLVGSTKYARS